MYIIVAPKRFQKSLKAFLMKHSEMRTVIEEKITILQSDPWHKQLKTHKLSGKLKDCLACNISYEYRLVFRVVENRILLLALGTHDEVY